MEEYGIVYLLTNPVMPGLVKIGMTGKEDIKTRMRELYTTGVPVPFECQYACRVRRADCLRIEQALHKAFAPQRVNSNREFFRIQVEQAVAILELFQHTDVTDAVVVEMDNELTDDDRAAATKANAESGPGKVQLQLWQRFKERLNATRRIHTQKTPAPRSWFDVPIGRSNVCISNYCSTWGKYVGVKLYISNKAVDTYFAPLCDRRKEIELALGFAPKWDANPAAKDKTIAIQRPVDFDDFNQMDEALDWMVEMTLKFHDVFSAELKKISA